MKKLIFYTLLLLSPVLSVAQGSALENIFTAYSGKEGYTTVNITKPMFELFRINNADSGDKDVARAADGLTSIRILTKDVDGPTAKAAGNAFYHEMMKAIPESQYESLMDINDGGSELKFLIRKTGNKITEFVMITGGDDACLMLLEGNIDLKKLSQLSYSMNVSQLNRFRSHWPAY